MLCRRGISKFAWIIEDYSRVSMIGVGMSVVKFEYSNQRIRFDDDLTMQVPVGAKVPGAFPVVRYGERFLMSIEPHTEPDLLEFKRRFGSSSSSCVTLAIEEMDQRTDE